MTSIKRIEAGVLENTLVDLKDIQDELAQRDRKHRDIETRENKQHLEGVETMKRQVKQIRVRQLASYLGTYLVDVGGGSRQ